MFNPMIQFRGDQYLSGGISQAASALGSGIADSLQRYNETKKQREFNSGIIEQLARVKLSTGQPLVEPDTMARFNNMTTDKQAGKMAGYMRLLTADTEQQTNAAKIAEMQAHTDYLKAAAQGKLDSGNWMPPTEETDVAAGANRTFLHTSPRSGQWLERPQLPQLDERGNPRFTPDGTMYLGQDGKLHPATGPMMQSREVYNLLNPPTPTPTPTPSASATAPASSSAAPTPAPTPAQTPSPQQYPIGTRARKGSAWYVMTANGWQQQ